MKTIYLKLLKSGNYRIVDKSFFTIKFTNEKKFINWYNLEKQSNSRIIKATYHLSQTYFTSAIEVLKRFEEKKYLRTINDFYKAYIKAYSKEKRILIKEKAKKKLKSEMYLKFISKCIYHFSKT